MLIRQYSASNYLDATGNFTVNIDGKECTARVENGIATITADGVTSGSHNVTVSYSGDNQYTKISKNSAINVPTKPVPTKKATVITPAKKKYTFKKSKRSKTKTFKVTLKIKGGSALAGKVVKIKLTNAKKIKLSKKAKKAISKAKKAVKKAKGKKAKAKAKKKLAKAMKPQIMLKQLKKGTFVVKTNGKGVAKLTLAKKSFTFKKSSGKLTAKFAGDNSYLGSSKTVKVVIK